MNAEVQTSPSKILGTKFKEFLKPNENEMILVAGPLKNVTEILSLGHPNVVGLVTSHPIQQKGVSHNEINAIKIQGWTHQVFETEESFLLSLKGLTNDHHYLVISSQATVPLMRSLEQLKAQQPVLSLMGCMTKTANDLLFGFSSQPMAAVVLCAPKEQVAGRLRSTFCWKPFGPARIVTKSSNDVVFEIDGVEVTEAFRKYMGHASSDFLKAAVNLPLAYYSFGSESDAFTIRDPIAVVDGGVRFSAPIPQGATVRFAQATSHQILETSHQQIIINRMEVPTPVFELCMLSDSRIGFLGSEFEMEFYKDRAKTPTWGFYGGAVIDWTLSSPLTGQGALWARFCHKKDSLMD